MILSHGPVPKSVAVASPGKPESRKRGSGSVSATRRVGSSCTHLQAFGLLVFFLLGCAPSSRLPTLVLQTDFGTQDGAVAAMKGVVLSVNENIPIQDLTHEIPPFNIWEAAWRLNEVAPYWPKGTIFVSVVDPGVGTDRRSVLLETNSGHYFVSPDNGTLTLVAETLGIAAVREIDESANIRPGSERSHTFHGRDLYSYTAARLAAGVISFSEVGNEQSAVKMLNYQKPEIVDRALRGMIPVLDVNFGNVWTNIPESMLIEFGVSRNDVVSVTITHKGSVVANLRMPYVRTFDDVPQRAPLLYVNSQGHVALAINLGDFSGDHSVGSGRAWQIEIRKRASSPSP